jgi:hypothetical protein
VSAKVNALRQYSAAERKRYIRQCLRATTHKCDKSAVLDASSGGGGGGGGGGHRRGLICAARPTIILTGSSALQIRGDQQSGVAPLRHPSMLCLLTLSTLSWRIEEDLPDS